MIIHCRNCKIYNTFNNLRIYCYNCIIKLNNVSKCKQLLRYSKTCGDLNTLELIYENIFSISLDANSCNMLQMNNLSRQLSEARTLSVCLDAIPENIMIEIKAKIKNICDELINEINI